MAKDKCDRNCSTCSVENRSFCAVQMAIANQELLMSLTKKLDDIVAQNRREDLINPACNHINTEPTNPGTVNSIV